MRNKKKGSSSTGARTRAQGLESPAPAAEDNTAAPVDIQPPPPAEEIPNDGAVGAETDNNNNEGSNVVVEPDVNEKKNAEEVQHPTETDVSATGGTEEEEKVDMEDNVNGPDPQANQEPREGIEPEGEIVANVQPAPSPLPIAIALPIDTNAQVIGAVMGAAAAAVDDQNLITPAHQSQQQPSTEMRNIDQHVRVLEAELDAQVESMRSEDHPTHNYVTIEQHDSTTNLLTQLMHRLSNQMDEIREHISVNLASKEDVMQLTTNTTEWMATQNQRIDAALANANKAATKIFTDGLAALTEQITEDISTRFAQATTEHEENMRVNRDACTAALEKIKKYEEQYSRLAKDASQYQQLKAKWEEVEQTAIATQRNVEDMVARGISNASNTLSPEQTAYTNEIIRNRDHVDDTVKNFLKELEDKAKAFGKTAQNIESAKTHISNLYKKLKDWVEIIKSSEKSKESAVQACLNQMSDIRTAHSSATETQREQIAQFQAHIDNLTNEIHRCKTLQDEQPNLDEARIAQTVQEYLQRGPIAQTGFGEDEFRARVISILHEQHPQITIERIHEIFEEENEIRTAIEQRLYRDFIKMLRADGIGPNSSSNLESTGDNNVDATSANKEHDKTTPAGSHPYKDEDEPAGYAGYYHFDERRKKIAYLEKEHWYWRECGYSCVREFEDIEEALAWMNDDEDVPEDLRRPMPEFTPSPMYNSESSMQSGERFRRDRFLEEHERDAQSVHSVEGYFGYNERGQTGAPYYVNKRGDKIQIKNKPLNLKMAGKRVPNERECQRASDEFARQDSYNQYGPSPSQSPYHYYDSNMARGPHLQTPPRYHQQQYRQQHRPSQQHGYPHHHPSQSPQQHSTSFHPDQQQHSPYEQSRGSYASNFVPHPTSPYNQGIDSALEPALYYLGGEEGWPVLQVGDFVRLGFLKPEQLAQVVAPIHQRVLNNWEVVGKYGTVTRGPNVVSLASSNTFTPLDSRKSADTINWYNNLGQLIEPFNIAITPFEHIEMRYGAHALCPPGMSVPKFKEMGRALSLLLTTKLLPMQSNADNSELSNALTIATDAGKPNGYELLHVTLQILVPAFDQRKVNIEWPLYSSYDSIFRYASAIEQTVMLAAKRGQRFSPKNAALQFLDGIIAEAGQAFIIQARILRTDVNSFTHYGPIPSKYELKKMAFEIQDSVPKDRPDSDLQRQASIYKSIATMTIEDRHHPTEQTTPSVSFAPSTSASGLESNAIVQGSSELIYRVNKAAYRPNQDRNRPARYPVPDPAKDLTKKRQSLYDPTITCDACRQRGHPAARCHHLAASLFLREFIEKQTNEPTMNRAMEHWLKRN